MLSQPWRQLALFLCSKLELSESCAKWSCCLLLKDTSLFQRLDASPSPGLTLTRSLRSPPPGFQGKPVCQPSHPEPLR